MKKGIGIVKCGRCSRTVPVAWPGQKYKMLCPACGATMSIHRQRLKKFKAFNQQ